MPVQIVYLEPQSRRPCEHTQCYGLQFSNTLLLLSLNYQEYINRLRLSILEKIVHASVNVSMYYAIQ